MLFDFIEEAREQGETLEEALLDAGVLRLAPAGPGVLLDLGVLDLKIVKWAPGQHHDPT